MAEIYKADLPILLGGEKVIENYKKSLLFTHLNELVPMIQQWEVL